MKPIIKHFKVFSEVNEVAKEENADLIVMGSHGATGLKELFIGSNTEKVIRFSEIPVIVVKKDMIDFNFNQVVFATDFSKESIGTYIRAKSMIDDFGGKMHVLYVNTPYTDFKTTYEMEKLAVDFFNVADGNTEKMKEVTFVCDKDVENGVLNFSNSFGADLIALSTHARKGLSHFFEGSISEDHRKSCFTPYSNIKNITSMRKRKWNDVSEFTKIVFQKQHRHIHFIFFCLVFVFFSCSKEEIGSPTNLAELLEAKSSLQLDEVIACAASKNQDDSTTYIYYYPIPEAHTISILRNEFNQCRSR